MTEKNTVFMPCCKALGSLNYKPETFLKFKDRGSSFKITQSVINVWEDTEECFQQMVKVTEWNLSYCKGIHQFCVKSIIPQVFTELESNMFDTPVNENYIFGLIKNIAGCYRKVRPYHLGKSTAKFHGKNVRKILGKLFLFFNHQ